MNKTLDFAFKLKEVKADGSFHGYGSVFGVQDYYDEVVAPGAFAESLAAHKAKNSLPALLWQHRSGEPREAPVACVVEPGGTWLVVGSNFGREKHPAWTGNLLKDPHAVVTRLGTTTPVTATLLEGEARDAAWDDLMGLIPVFDRYEDRSGRSLRVFRLTPT